VRGGYKIWELFQRFVNARSIGRPRGGKPCGVKKRTGFGVNCLAGFISRRLDLKENKQQRGEGGKVDNLKREVKQAEPSWKKLEFKQTRSVQLRGARDKGMGIARLTKKELIKKKGGKKEGRASFPGNTGGQKRAKRRIQARKNR